jgi:hypothetical protein
MNQQEAGWKLKVDLFRKRFGAREDVFGVKYYYTQTQYSPDDIARENPQLVSTSMYQPQCMNYGDQNVCLIAQNRGGCSTCDHKKYQPLTDEWLWKHISGEKELILYLLQRDGIKFGACDFDRGTHFEDAKAVRDASQKMGLPCYIARSSKKGYHLYWFFSEVVPAHLFTSLVSFIYNEVGFNQRYQENPTNPPPEVFPKQTTFNPAPSNPGNGIKIPMIEPKFREGFNCWVDDDAKPYAYEDQWDYFRACSEVSLKQLERAIDENSIPIIHAPVGRGKKVHEPVVGPDGEILPKDAIKPRGDFWRVVNNCPALKQFWEKDEAGAYKIPPDAKGDHAHRTASIAFAIATENGLDAIRDRWGTERVEKEITYALQSVQHPYTCRALQESGVCRVGMHPVKKDHCIRKTAPGEYVNGQYRENPNNLPESEWKEPSPIRFASGFKTYEQILSSLVDLLAFQNQKVGDQPAPPPPDLDERLKELIRLSHSLHPSEREQFKNEVEIRKIMSKKDLKQVYKAIERAKKEEDVSRKKEESAHFSYDGGEYFHRPEGYIMISRGNDGTPREHELCNFTVDILEEITLIKPKDLDDPSEEYSVTQRGIKGVVRHGKKHAFFRVPSNEWLRSAETFFSHATNVAGTSLIYQTKYFNEIRNCISEFSKEKKVIRKKVEDFGHYKLKGQHAFVTPSVIITKDEIKPNTEFELEFTDETCKCLDFKIIDDSQFKDLALHIINDYFECSSSIATMTLFAHAMAASILSHISLMKSPVLWVDGSFGEGKSFIASIAQCFYGNFSNLTASDSTGVGKLAIAHKFRDAFLVMDDFKKSLSEYSTKQIIQFIQKAYDRTGRVAAKRDGTPRDESTKIRGLIAITGEEPPLDEASAVSRLLLVNTKKGSMNKAKGEIAEQRKGEYCGFTPYFIQYVYRQGEAEVKKMYIGHLAAFEKKGKEDGLQENMYRICQNMALNMTAFNLAMNLLVDKGVIPVQKGEELCARQMKNLEICREDVAANTGAQRGATVFLNRLKELLQDPVRYHITNLPGYDPTDNKNSKALGFCRSADPGVVFIYQGTAHGEVETHLSKTKNWSQTQHHIGRQLFEDGHVVAYDPKSTGYTKYVKTPNGNRIYCWAIKLESLGFTTEPVPPKKVEPLPDNVVKIAAVE